MSDSTRDQFLAAGARLYPQYGYDKLSVRVLAAEAGLSSGMFHHLFASKEAFVREVLDARYGETFGQIDFVPAPDLPLQAQLAAILRLYARYLRDNLDWMQRIFADSAAGVAVVSDFVRAHFSRYARGVLMLMHNAAPRPLPEQIERLAYLNASVMAPLFLGQQFVRMGVLPDEFAGIVDVVFSDAAIERRIAWSLGVLFAEDV